VDKKGQSSLSNFDGLIEKKKRLLCRKKVYGERKGRRGMGAKYLKPTADNR